MFSVFGAGGFIGRRLVALLSEAGQEVVPVTRQTWPPPGQHLGHVIYAVGLTSDFRMRPLDTVEAHVSLLSEVLKAANFDSLVYLSSTRIYRGAEGTREDASLAMSPADPDRLYDFSKLCGEALCLSDPRGKVARLSNVYGELQSAGNFLGMVVEEALTTSKLVLGQTLRSEKDYVHVDDVCRALMHISTHGAHRLYNVAAGFNTSHGQIAEVLRAVAGVSVTVEGEAADVIHRPIDVSRLAGEIEWTSRRLVDDLPALIRTRGYGNTVGRAHAPPA